MILSGVTPRDRASSISACVRQRGVSHEQTHKNINRIPKSSLKHRYLAGTVKTCVQSDEHPDNCWCVVALYCIERFDPRQPSDPPVVLF